MKPIFILGEPGSEDSTLTGGKAANLGRLAATYPIPPGFCLTASAYLRWSGLVAPREEGAPLGPLPAELVGIVEEAYAALSARCGGDATVVAVRSSAIDEDGADASFAGLYTTYLNVRGAAAVLDAIARCWASATTPRVAAYRKQKGRADASLGVLVQALVIADTSAVVFSANPATGAEDEVMINANYGLGESIVGGVTTPDTWTLRRPGLETIRFDLGHKEQMTVRSAEGTREIAVLRALRGRPSLLDAQVRELAQLALRLEDEMGWPVDIECAYQGEKLYLLQCRPITTRKTA